jgi:tRNA-2-methylthio-N6-dimethylallyladenosine synthase
MPNQVPKQVVQERYERLVELQDQISWDENSQLVGRTVELLVAEGEGRKDAATHRMTGRARDGRLVHFAADPAADPAVADIRAGDIRAGDIVTTAVTYAAPHHLNADGGIITHRRTVAGDNWAAGRAPRTSGVMLGLPTIGAPAAQPATGCG